MVIAELQSVRRGTATTSPAISGCLASSPPRPVRLLLPPPPGSRAPEVAETLGRPWLKVRVKNEGGRIYNEFVDKRNLCGNTRFWTHRRSGCHAGCAWDPQTHRVTRWCPGAGGGASGGGCRGQTTERAPSERVVTEQALGTSLSTAGCTWTPVLGCHHTQGHVGACAQWGSFMMSLGASAQTAGAHSCAGAQS